MSKKNKLDSLDYRILEKLQIDGSISNKDLAKEIGLSPPATLVRVRSLRKKGYISRARYFPDYPSLGFNYVCIVIAKCPEIYCKKFKELLENSPGVIYSVRVTRDAEFEIMSDNPITYLSHCAYKSKAHMIQKWSEIVAEIDEKLTFQIYEAHERTLAKVPVELEKELIN